MPNRSTASTACYLTELNHCSCSVSSGVVVVHRRRHHYHNRRNHWFSKEIVDSPFDITGTSSFTTSKKSTAKVAATSTVPSFQVAANNWINSDDGIHHGMCLFQR